MKVSTMRTAIKRCRADLEQLTARVRDLEERAVSLEERVLRLDKTVFPRPTYGPRPTPRKPRTRRQE